jgi:hypothetical protein
MDFSPLQQNDAPPSNPDSGAHGIAHLEATVEGKVNGVNGKEGAKIDGVNGASVP